MTETILVKAISSRPKYPKFNSGAVLVDDVWINVSSEVDINTFTKGSTSEVEMVTNKKGYKLITGVKKPIDVPSISPLADKPGVATVMDVMQKLGGVKSSYQERDFDAEARGKSRFGLYAAIVPAFVHLGLEDEETKKRSDELVEYFMSKIFTLK